jgi:protein O-GlcNAc transferase
MNTEPIKHAFDLALQRQQAGRLHEAIAIYRQLLLLLPKSVEIRVNLAAALKEAGEVNDAITILREVLSANPNSFSAWTNLGIAWRINGRLDEAIAAFEKATELKPQSPIAWNNLGLTLQDTARLDDAIRCFDRALAIDPQFAWIDSNRLYALHFHEHSDAKHLYEEHRRWAARHADPLKNHIRPFDNDRSPQRRLKIGYVSGDFREHVVGRFLLPLLASHDKTHVEIHCYNSRAGEADFLTKRLRSCADIWRDIANRSDDDAAQIIRDDRIDILIDLSMHMANNRMLLFARKPAPVQVTYLAYCSTTGLDAIDYRITDSFLDPPGQDDSIYAEQSIRLPETYWCYEPGFEAAEPNSPPVLTAGHITFGCLNNFCKVTPVTLNVWFELLRALPTARLILHAHEGSHRQHLCDLAADAGVDRARISFVGFQPLQQYMEFYRHIDIALDSFPYSGGTTTCDALWMGVPVITLRGKTAVGRGGVSILSNLGLTELIAGDSDEYVNIAKGLATDLPRLTELRKSLRGKMLRSPLMEAKKFAENIESAYRRMWEGWCAKLPPVTGQ